MANSVNFSTLNIFQWNAQNLKPKRLDFEGLLSQESIHLAILSETWLDIDTDLNISGYNVLRRDREDSYGGVALIIHKSVKVQSSLTRLNNVGIEMLHVKVLNCSSLENVVSVYCPSSVHVSQTDWDSLFNLFLNKKSIIAGDFNAHHTNWSFKNDSRGIQILDSAIESGFISLNDGSPTRTKLVNGVLQKSSPDITFVSSDIAIKFRWSVTNESLGSDHLIIKFTLNFERNYNTTKKRNYRLADWKSYREYLDLAFQSSIETTNIQDKYNYFITQINTAADKNIPLIKICNNPISKFRPKPYWNPDLSRAVAQRRLALKLFRRNPTPINLTRLEKCIAESKNLIRKARQQSWNGFCNDIDQSTSASEMWQRMRWIKGYKKAPFLPSNLEKEELLCNLAPDSVIPFIPTIRSTNTSLEADFNFEEMNACLKRTDTAPGGDNITYSMIYNLPTIAKLYLLDIFNLIYLNGDIPLQWRHIQIIPIPKLNHSMNSPIKLRPIALMSCVCKILHTMIAKRLEWFVEKNEILSRKTVGFRRCQSSIDALVRLVCHIQINFSNKVPTLACFLDIDNAYNNVNINKVVSTLDDIKAGLRLCRYIWMFLCDRRLSMKSEEINNMHLCRWTHQGIAQGDPLSPLIFNIVTSKITHNINNVFISQYADDFLLYTSHSQLNYSINSMQLALNTVFLLLKDIGLQLSTSKSKYCLFSRGFRTQSINLQINNEILKSTENIKYLGMWLDRSLRWGKHINEICQKTQKCFNLLKTLSGSSWGVHPKHIRRLYIALIRSRMDYGCFIYDNSANSHTYKLDKIQNQCLRIVGGFIKSTPIHTMECELCIPPLFIRRYFLAVKYTSKAKSWSDNITVRLLNELSDLCTTRYWQNKKLPLLVTSFREIKDENIHSSYPLEMFTLNTWVTNIRIHNIIKCNLDSVKTNKNNYNRVILRHEVSHELRNKYDGWCRIYTDGSKSADGLGAAYFDPQCNYGGSFRVINCYLSVMTLELTAISEALKYVKDKRYNKVVILTDSKSALQHIARCASGFRGVPKAFTILTQIDEFRHDSIDLILQWIPSHIGILGNEKVDLFAKQAALTGTTYSIKSHYSELLSKYKPICNNMWKEYFDRKSQEKGIWYRTIQCEPPHIPWFADVKINRKNIVLAHRLRTGHMPLNKFGFLMKKVSSPNCEHCGTIEDVHHLLMECARYRRERNILLTELKINRSDLGSLLCILSNPHSEGARKIYKFVSRCLSQ